MVQRIKLETIDDAVRLSQYAVKSDCRIWLMDNGERECIDARSIIGVIYAMSKFKRMELCVFDDSFAFPDELKDLKI